MAARQRIDWMSVAAFSLPLVVYLLTLAPTIYNLDSAELTTAVASNGIIRATGYPLYLFLGRIWINLVPVGDIGYRLNLFSAVCGATTILLAEYILRRFQVTVWARVGALGLFNGRSLLLGHVPHRRGLHITHCPNGRQLSLPCCVGGKHPVGNGWYWPVFLMALSMGNHAATILLVPACVWYVLVTAPRSLIRPSTWLTITLGLIAGATIFLYLPWQYSHNPTFNYAGSYDWHRHIPSH